MPFIINEDGALKSLLSGMTVSDSGNAARPVGVFYGQPDKEIRAQSYPYITIDLIGVREDTNRAHRGYVPMTYTPEGADAEIEHNVNFPIPVDLMYQVSTWSRQPRHDRQLMALLFSSGRLPFRFGQLLVPEDNTMRRLDMMGFTKRDANEGGKRLFNNIYNVRVSSELFPDQLVQMYQVLETPTISLETQDTPFTTITN
jgi:hypothetical protein